MDIFGKKVWIREYTFVSIIPESYINYLSSNDVSKLTFDAMKHISPVVIQTSSS